MLPETHSNFQVVVIIEEGLVEFTVRRQKEGICCFKFSISITSKAGHELPPCFGREESQENENGINNIKTWSFNYFKLSWTADIFRRYKSLRMPMEETTRSYGNIKQLFLGLEIPSIVLY